MAIASVWHQGSEIEARTHPELTEKQALAIDRSELSEPLMARMTMLQAQKLDAVCDTRELDLPVHDFCGRMLRRALVEWAKRDQIDAQRGARRGQRWYVRRHRRAQEER